MEFIRRANPILGYVLVGWLAVACWARVLGPLRHTHPLGYFAALVGGWFAFIFLPARQRDRLDREARADRGLIAALAIARREGIYEDDPAWDAIDDALTARGYDLQPVIVPPLATEPRDFPPSRYASASREHPVKFPVGQ